jgi:hypothetical protein
LLQPELNSGSYGLSAEQGIEETGNGLEVGSHADLGKGANGPFPGLARTRTNWSQDHVDVLSGLDDVHSIANSLTDGVHIADVDGCSACALAGAVAYVVRLRKRPGHLNESKDDREQERKHEGKLDKRGAAFAPRT